MAKQSMTEWLSSGKYLPRFLRDFHDQKDVFKCIGEWVEKAKQNDSSVEGYLKGITWSAAHVYVIDYFLWYCAKHGYTLQKTRFKSIEFREWSDTIADRKTREVEAWKGWMNEKAKVESNG